MNTFFLQNYIRTNETEALKDRRKPYNLNSYSEAGFIGCEPFFSKSTIHFTN